MRERLWFVFVFVFVCVCVCVCDAKLMLTPTRFSLNKPLKKQPIAIHSPPPIVHKKVASPKPMTHRGGGSLVQFTTLEETKKAMEVKIKQVHAAEGGIVAKVRLKRRRYNDVHNDVHAG